MYKFVARPEIQIICNKIKRKLKRHGYKTIPVGPYPEYKFYKSLPYIKKENMVAEEFLYSRSYLNFPPPLIPIQELKEKSSGGFEIKKPRYERAVSKIDSVKIDNSLNLFNTVSPGTLNKSSEVKYEPLTNFDNHRINKSKEYSKRHHQCWSINIPFMKFQPSFNIHRDSKHIISNDKLKDGFELRETTTGSPLYQDRLYLNAIKLNDFLRDNSNKSYSSAGVQSNCLGLISGINSADCRKQKLEKIISNIWAPNVNM